jgi:glutamine---fructose-6-phosphate transaminase (isomerizing)
MNYDKIDLKWQNMMAGIEAQVTYLRETPHVVYQQVCEKLALEKAPERIYLVGCGDSWYCGIATELAFQTWTGIPTRAMQALEFSRYEVNLAPKNSLVVGISNSGRVRRTVEAMICARQAGMKTVAGTRLLDSQIAQESEVLIDLGYAEMAFAPGTSSYMASMVVEYCIALHVAEVAGKMTKAEVEAKLDQICAEADGMQKTIDAAKPVLEKLGEETKQGDKIIFMGGGPNYGTAFFSMAKAIETGRAYATGQEMEEWAHEQYFVTDSDTVSFFIAPKGASVSRAREQLWAANEMGSTTVAICDANDEETAKLAKVVVPVYTGGDELLSPLNYCIPGELFGFFYAVSKNLSMLGFNDPHVKSVNFQQIFNSKIIS